MLHPLAPQPPGGTGLLEDIEVDGDGRLILQCGDAPPEVADLAHPDCLAAVLRTMRETAAVRDIILVRDREKAFGPRARSALRALLAITRLLDQLATREPTPDFPGFTAKEVAAVCAKCPFRPARMFEDLRSSLFGGPHPFLEALKDLAASLEEYEEEGCEACMGATIQDLRVLLAELKPAGA